MQFHSKKIVPKKSISYENKIKQEQQEPIKPSTTDLIFCAAMLSGICYWVKPQGPPPKPPYYLLLIQNDMDEIM